MAAQNTEVVRCAVDAVVRGDREAFLALLTPDVEWDDREGWPGVRQVYHGQAGVRQWLDAFTSVGGEIVSAEIEDLAEVAGGRVLLCVFGTFRGHASGSASEFNVRAWYVFSLRGGQISRAQLFWTRSEALHAAGLAD